jgi:regulator of protease activity HflC (stomatin/prohibitin superfamily)
MIAKRVFIKSSEIGLVFRNGEFQRVLEAGAYWLANFSFNTEVRILDKSIVWFQFPELEQVVKSGTMNDRVEFVDLNDNQRALVWRDERFKGILKPGLHGLWKEPGTLRYKIVDIRDGRFVSDDLDVILKVIGDLASLKVETVPDGSVGVIQRAGREPEVIEAGRHAFWKDAGPYTIKSLDLRETVQDVTGQEILTGDKVTVRLNASISAKITDPVLTVTRTADVWQSLYRDIQLALRAVVGTRDLNSLLADKVEVVSELEEMVRACAEGTGVTVLNVGIRDIILPGEMKELMNKVIQAQKAAEANLISRREEVAAMRSQANTARILEGNPTLMRLKELEVLESIAGNGKLEVILGEKGLADRVVNLL